MVKNKLLPTQIAYSIELYDYTLCKIQCNIFTICKILLLNIYNTMKYSWILTTAFVPDTAGISIVPHRFQSMIYFLTVLHRYFNIIISPLSVADVLDWQINSNRGTEEHILLSSLIAVNYFTLVSSS